MSQFRFMRLFMAICLSLVLFGFSFCTPSRKVSDPNATIETKNLYQNLEKIAQNGYLVGHQDALAYGVKWKYVNNQSDVKSVAGDYPGLYGWELGHLELGNKINLDSVPFEDMRRFIREGYERGGAITISWHGVNPINGKSAWDTTRNTISKILPDGAYHHTFVKQLDKVADFLKSLNGANGKAIPILFRPFHECSGNWFWWGVTGGNAQEYKALFRFSIDYLRIKKNLNNLLVVYNTGTEFTNEEEFLERYPGDDYVDILSFDTYQRKPTSSTLFAKNLDRHLEVVCNVANERGKLAAVGEIGYNQIPDQNWFTNTIGPVFKKHKIAYMLLWRNAGYKWNEKEMEYYAPFKGHESEADFVKYAKQPETLFEKDAAAYKLYNR